MTVPASDPLPGLWSAHAWRPGPQSPNHDTVATRKLELARRLVGLVSKQRPKIKAPDASPPYRPTRESIVAALSHDPKSSAHTPYPHVPHAANRADPYFSPRAGTELNQITPSYGVGEAHRYGRGDVYNVGSLGDTGTPGSQMRTTSRYRIGELPTRRGSRKRPPNKYGTKDGVSVDRAGPRTAPLDGHQYIEQQSETSENPYRKPSLVGVATQPRSRRPSRRQGYLPLDASKQAANVQGDLHTLRYLGDGKARRKRRKQVRIAKLLAKRCELASIRDVLIAQSQAKLVELKVTRDYLLKQQQQQQALAQADEALQSINNKFVKGYHSDSSFFRVWERAIELTKQEQEQPVTMKGLR
jgi:hypothetical protein